MHHPLPLASLALILSSISAASSHPSNGIEARSNGSARVLHVPNSPAEGRQVIGADFQSYSIEFSYMQDYAGNNSYPNTFSARMIQNLKDISGAYPMFRVGGSTQNRAVYHPEQEEAVILTFSSPGADQPSGVTIGPAWVETFQQFPKGTKYIYGLSFYDNHDKLIGGRDGINETVSEASLVYNAIKDDLYAFEIGNEVDGWPCGSRRPCNWTIESYVLQWEQYATAVEAALGTSEPLFQGCAFEAPRHIGYNKTPFWNVENAINFGMNKTLAKTVADHDYMGSACSPGATIEANVLNHAEMTSRIFFHDYLGNATAPSGIEYVLGETNSISCQGLAGASDVFAAALWSVDYVLYIASLKVSRLHFHMGTPYRYSPWQPIDYRGKPAEVKPLYYGNLFTATALAGGNKQVEVLVNETRFTAYAIYDAGPPARGHSTLKSVVVANLAMWNSTQPASERPYTRVTLPMEFNGATVRRLTSPGVEISTNITFAGQYVDNSGRIQGNKNVELVQDGDVYVGAGEAVLVCL